MNTQLVAPTQLNLPCLTHRFCFDKKSAIQIKHLKPAPVERLESNKWCTRETELDPVLSGVRKNIDERSTLTRIFWRKYAIFRELGIHGSVMPMPAGGVWSAMRNSSKFIVQKRNGKTSHSSSRA